MQLARLALHYPKLNLMEQEYQLMREDMIRDLLAFHPGRVADACDAWRKSDARHFPTSGQLIALIRQRLSEHSSLPVYHAPLPPPDAKFPKDLRPWREVLIANGRDPSKMPPRVAAALDQMQGLKAPPPVPQKSKVPRSLADLPVVPISEALRKHVREQMGFDGT